MYNKVIQVGNMVRDPEMKYTNGGKPVLEFAIAVNKRSKKDGTTTQTTSYFDVVAFDRMAETINEYCGKGDRVLVDGELKQERWDDKNTGAKRSKIVIVAHEVKFMAQKGEQSQQQRGDAQAPAPAMDDEDDVPF